MFKPQERAFKTFKCPRPQCVNIWPGAIIIFQAQWSFFLVVIESMVQVLHCDPEITVCILVMITQDRLCMCNITFWHFRVITITMEVQ